MELIARVVVLLSLLLMVTARVGAGTSAERQDLVVGGDAGWRVGYDYKSWSKEVPVRAGDVLEFRYTTPDHTVTLLKTQEDFDSCNSSDPIEIHSGGCTRIELGKPGRLYFVDSFGDHCLVGVKMATDVAP